MVGRRKGSSGLTPLEIAIMQVLWQAGPSNVQAVQELLDRDAREGAALAYTTVQTMLNILHRKGKVERSLQGRAYVYRAVVSREKAMVTAVRELVERMFAGSPEDLVMSMIKTRQVDPERIASLSKELVLEASAPAPASAQAKRGGASDGVANDGDEEA